MPQVSRTVSLSILLITLAACGSSTPDAAPTPAIHATWTWSGMATSCASIAGATQVSILATAAGTSTLYAKVVPCAAGQGTLSLPSAGTYIVVLSLDDAMSASIDASAAQMVNVTGTSEVTTSFDGIP
jgi:hypothetical protein